MTRKSLIIFALSSIILYPILLGIFGQTGYLHNKQLEKEINDLNYEKEVLFLQVQSLEEQKEQMASADAMKDAAFKFGYQSNGEQVYYFIDDYEGESQNEHTVTQEKSADKNRFEGLSQVWILLMTLAFSLLLTVSYVFVAHRSDVER